MQICIPNCAISGDNLAVAGGDESDRKEGKRKRRDGKEIKNE